MYLTLIWASTTDGVIGETATGAIPWECKPDLKNFARLTKGHACIVGRKTFDQLPPLKGRKLIVVSRNGELNLANNTPFGVVSTVKGALKLAYENDPEPFCIGGAEIYKELLPYADRLIHTTMDCLELKKSLDLYTYFVPDMNGFDQQYSHPLPDSTATVHIHCRTMASREMVDAWHAEYQNRRRTDTEIEAMPKVAMNPPPDDAEGREVGGRRHDQAIAMALASAVSDDHRCALQNLIEYPALLDWSDDDNAYTEQLKKRYHELCGILRLHDASNAWIGDERDGVLTKLAALETLIAFDQKA